MPPLPEVVELTGARLPPRLADLPEPPPRLYVHGELPRGPCIAVVGTRHPTGPAYQFAYRLARQLALSGITVVSGGAEGIDSGAHRGALRARGSTVVVAASGFDRPFPWWNARLFRRVVERGGAYVSLVPPHVPARPPAFFVRNAILVALSHAVVVVEAPFRSGTRNAAKHARTLGRPVFVVPAAPWTPQGAGCLLELELGGRILRSPKRLFDWLRAERLHALPRPLPGAVSPEKTSEFLGGSPNQPETELVLGAVRNGADHADLIVAQTGLGPASVQASLLTLTLRGALVADSNGRIRIING
jgi:DNA processing protein